LNSYLSLCIPFLTAGRRALQELNVLTGTVWVKDRDTEALATQLPSPRVDNRTGCRSKR